MSQHFPALNQYQAENKVSCSRIKPSASPEYQTSHPKSTAEPPCFSTTLLKVSMISLQKHNSLDHEIYDEVGLYNKGMVGKLCILMGHRL